MSNEITLQEYINKKKEVYSIILQYIDDEENDLFDDLIKKIKAQINPENPSELKLFIRLLIDISNNHHRNPNFFEKLFCLFQCFDIKQTLTNSVIFDLTKSNKIILLYLIDQKIITINEEIVELTISMMHNNQTKYCLFFYPEIKEFVDIEKQKILENELLKYDSDIFTNFDEKRRKGENDTYVCNLIRDDSIKDFIIYVNKANIPLSCHIKQSIFETNLLLLDNQPTLIEYAAFFGSIQIFQYLKYNNVELTDSLWKYAIHSNNAELIHIIEENLNKPSKQIYESCFLESIKCHHNNIAKYFRDTFLLMKNEDQMNESTFDTILTHYNYEFFPHNFGKNIIFASLFEYGYLKLVDLYLKAKENLIKQNKINSFYDL